MSTQNQSKGELMKAIMSNRRSSDMFRNAFKSPLGSTSRTTAQRVFGIMNKLQSKRDGAGGPGIMPQIQSGISMEQPTQDGRNMVVFHKLPPININYGGKPRDGSGGAGDTNYSSLNLSSLYPLLPNTNINPLVAGITLNQSPDTSLLNQLWAPTSGTIETGGSSSLGQAPSLFSPSSFSTLNLPSSQTNVVPNLGGPVTVNPFIVSPPKVSTPSSPWLTITGKEDTSRGMSLSPSTVEFNTAMAAAKTASDRNIYMRNQAIIALKNIGFVNPSEGEIEGMMNEIETNGAPPKVTEEITNGIPSGTPEVYQQTYRKPVTSQVGETITPSTPTSTLQDQVKGALAQSMGPNMFAWKMITSPTDVVTGGKSAAQAYEENRLDLWGKYNIGGLQDQMINARAVGATLPKDLQNYIRGRDEYLNQTDQMINSYIDTMGKSDMSDPINRTKANDYLNYLYTLRGATNKRYIDYTNSAIDDFNAGLQTLNDQYTVALNGYQTELTSQNAITKDMYDTYYAALSDMYTNLEQAPLKQKQMELLNIQILGAQAQIIADAAAAKAQGSYLADASKLTGHITDTSGYILPGLNLVDTIKEYESLEPGMNAASIVAKYAEGVNRFLSTADGSKTQSGDEINFTKKLSTAQDAIEQFANLASEGLAAQNANTYALGQKYANDIAGKIASTIGGTLGNDEVAKSMTEVIQTLEGGWFGGAPEKQDFIKDMTTKIGGTVNKSIADALPGIAEAIYNNYLEYIKSGGSAASFVQSLLYDTTSTTDRAKLVLSTPSQLAQKIGISYALSLLNQSGLSTTE